MAQHLSTRVRFVASGSDSREIWHDVIRNDPNINVQQTPAWADCICRCDGLEDATRCYESTDGRRIVLPLVRGRRLPSRLSSESSWPGAWGACGPLSSDGRIFAEDVAAIIADLQAHNVLRTSFSVPRPTADQLWDAHVPSSAVRRSHQTHVIDISGGFEAVWEGRFSGVARTACRKGERRGIRVESDTTGRLLPVFDELYRKSVDRWAEAQGDPLPIARLLARRHEPLRKFQIVADILGEGCEVHIASLDGKPLAGTIVLTHGSVATYWRGAMDKEAAAGTAANELLHRRAIELACGRGCLQYDMQRSPSSGVARFKSKLGAQPREFVDYQLENIPVTALERRARRVARRMLGRPAR